MNLSYRQDPLLESFSYAPPRSLISRAVTNDPRGTVSWRTPHCCLSIEDAATPLASPTFLGGCGFFIHFFFLNVALG